MFSRRKVSLSALQALLPLIAGPAILSFGLYNIHEPCGVTEGGVLGMTLLLHHWLGLSPSASGLVMNLASYLLGMRYLGRGFLKKSLVSAAAFSAFYALWERFPPLLPNLGAWPLAAAIAGALFVGVG
ncbi:YitT family protein, partial [Allofournierella sp.]